MVLKLIQPIKGYFEELNDEILAEFLSEFVHVEVALPFLEGEIFGENVEEVPQVLLIRLPDSFNDCFVLQKIWVNFRVWERVYDFLFLNLKFKG